MRAPRPPRVRDGDRRAARVRRAVPVLRAVAPALAAVAVPAARAAETAAPPSHLAPYNLDWLAYVDPADLSPSRPAICLVDAGVAVTPDTPPDDPLGPIVARVAIDYGSGEPEGTLPAQLHGTRMAMLSAAPQNDWGTVGMYPQGRIVSVRALTGGATVFPPENYEVGIQRCLKIAETIPIAAINLSLACQSGCELSDATQASLQGRIDRARAQGVAVVAAAGNEPHRPTSPPASLTGVIAVAGGGADAPCPDATVDGRVDLVAPGCPVAGADPLTGEPANEDGGSSAATMTVSTLVAAIRAMRPDATLADVEGWVRAGAPTTRVDGEAVAHAADLRPQLDRARARMRTGGSDAAPAPSATPSTPRPPFVAAQRTRRVVVPPDARASWSRGTLRLRLRRVPRQVRLTVRIGRAAPRHLPARRTASLRLKRPVRTLRLRYVSTDRAAPGRSRFVMLSRRGTDRYG